MNKLKTHVGRSMVEMLGVLAIIGVLSVGGIAGYNAAMSKHRINVTTDAVSKIIQGTRSMFALQDSYTGLGAWKSNSAEAQDRSPAQIIVSATGTDFPFPIELSGKEDGSGFEIKINGLSKSSCTSIASAGWNIVDDDFSGIAINEGEESSTISVGNAVGSCADDSTVTLSFVSFDVASSGGGNTGGGDTGGETTPPTPDPEPEPEPEPEPGDSIYGSPCSREHDSKEVDGVCYYCTEYDGGNLAWGDCA